MSNAALSESIRVALAAAEAEPLCVQALAQLRTALKGSGNALEGMPYQLVEECDSIAMDLQYAEWDLEEDTLPEVQPILSRTHLWLEQVPRI